MRFYLFDKIIEFESNERCVGVKSVSLSEDFFKEHYSRSPIMPESLVLESIGQVGSWATAASNDFEAVSVLLKVGSFKSFKSVVPGDMLRLEVDILSNNDFGSIVSGVAKVNDVVVAQAEEIAFWSYKYEGMSKEFEREFNLYRSGDSSVRDNAWYSVL